MELPKYFVIKKDPKNYLWGKFIMWLNKTYNENWTGEVFKYYGYDGSFSNHGTNVHNSLERFKNNPVLITLEDWNSIVNEFKYLLNKLPEEYIVECDNLRELNQVNHYFYQVPYELIWHFKYIICKKSLIIGEEQSISADSIDNKITPPFEHLIVFTYKEWEHLVSIEKPLIVGYRLLKRLPGLNAGIEFTRYKDVKWGFEDEESEVYFSDKEVLDTEFFEPIYNKDTFSEGDLVTFYSVVWEKNVTGRIIEWSSSSYCRLDNGLTPFKHLLKKATSEEVLNYNIEKFTSSTGITIGSTINEIKTSKRICWSDEKEGWFSVNILSNREIIEFKMHTDNNTLLLQLTGTTKDIWYDAYKLIKAYPDALDVTINGYKAKFTENSVSFGCQTYSKEFVLALAECLRENNFKMDHKDSILKIAEYFNHSKS